MHDKQRCTKRGTITPWPKQEGQSRSRAFFSQGLPKTKREEFGAMKKESLHRRKGLRRGQMEEEGGHQETTALMPSALRVTLTTREHIPDNDQSTHP
jgi:hypothetical protein